MESFWLIALLLPWGWAVLLGLWPRRWDRSAALLALVGTVATATCVTLAAALRPATGQMELVARFDWVPTLGLELLVMRDGLSAMVALLASWIAVLVTLFAWRYLPHAREEEGSGRRLATFYALMSGFTGAMLGLVSAGHLLQFYLFWELTGVASFLLIGFWSHQEGARQGAVRSLVMTTAGSLAMLVGLLGLGALGGAWTFPELLRLAPAWPVAGWPAIVTALILIGAIAKSAQFPFSSWLPGAMTAPAPVSAYLHSSALVAAGVYLIARFFPILSPVPTWSYLLIGSGLVGGIIAGLVALRQAEIKALLAYSTISQYAFIFLAFGLATTDGAQAGLYAFFIHALIKAGLFLVAGAVTYLTGEKTFTGVSGLVHTHPVLAAFAVMAALSLGGVPIFGGFYYKEELLHAAYDHQAWLLLGAMLFGGMLTLLYMMRFLSEIFFGRPALQAPLTPLPITMGIPIALLAGASAMTGIFPNWMNTAVLNPAIASVVRTPTFFVVELHPGGVLLLSLGVLAGAAALWSVWLRGHVPLQWFLALPERLTLGGRLGMQGYDRASDAVLRLQNGNLRRYLRLEMLAALALTLYFARRAPWEGWPPVTAVDPILAMVLGLCVVSGGATVWLRQHVLAVLALTISGFALAAAFALMHAPNIAIVQVLVETLATLAIVMALRQSRLVQPQHTDILSAGKRDWGRWMIAIVAGAFAGGGTLWATREPPGVTAGEWYATEGYRQTGMADLVIAILTDFRALDTAIEILVFASAAFAIIGLFRHREGRHG